MRSFFRQSVSLSTSVVVEYIKYAERVVVSTIHSVKIPWKSSFVDFDTVVYFEWKMIQKIYRIVLVIFGGIRDYRMAKPCDNPILVWHY